MKYIHNYITAFLLISGLYSCQDINKEFEGLDDLARPTGTDKVEHILISDDYALMADMAVAGGVSAKDSADAKFVDRYEHFNDSIKASNYVPYILGDYYPGLGIGAAVVVTYDYNGEMPENLVYYTDAAEYPLKDADYISPDSLVNKVGFYSPSYPPHLYIPDILKRNVIGSKLDFVMASFQYSNVDPKFDPNSSADLILFEDDFSGNTTLSNWTIKNVIGNNPWHYYIYDDDGSEYARVRTYNGTDNPANTCWMITPAINLEDTQNESFSFVSGAFTFGDDPAAPILEVKWSADYDGTSDPSAATWTDFTGFDLAPTDATYDWTPSGNLSLDAISGNIFIAFVFDGAENAPTTWAIDDVRVFVPDAGISYVGEDPEELKEYYSYDSISMTWSKEDDVYYVNAFDYQEMGSYKNYFSAGFDPAMNIPNLLNSRLSVAAEGTEMIVVYNYNNDINDDLSVLADKYTLTNGIWVSSYNFIEPKTDQYLNFADGWKFDPTINIKMAGDDFQVIVDWVNAQEKLGPADEPGSEYVNSFGTGEDYHGADAYYENFDIRDNNWESGTFDSWEKAIESALGNVYLPIQYPNAQLQVDGVDQQFVINFDTYSGEDGNYNMKFQVTKAGPNPEFILLEGPY